MHSIGRVRQQILLGIGGSFALAAGVACGGRMTGSSDETGGTSAGAAGTEVPGTTGSGEPAGAPSGSGGSAGGSGTGGLAGASGGSGGASGASGTGGVAGMYAGGSGGSAAGTGGTGGIRDAGCPQRDAQGNPICLPDPANRYGTVCFTEAGLLPYLTLRPAPSPNACSSSPERCPSIFEFTQRYFCGGALSGPFSIVGDQCCYALSSGAVDGRPFMIDGKPRQASVVRREDWQTAGPLPADTPERHDCERLAEAWLTDATAEHASIASFARLTLELLSLGAPPDLLVAAQNAALDEIEHARLCFALASRYAGRSCGPGKLSMASAVRNITLSELAVAAVFEGCVGETIAAVLAGERLARASDPEVHAALAKIADDEARHAALAWRTVVWAIDEGGPGVREAVRDAFADAVAPYLGADDVHGEPVDAADGLLAHGQLPFATARRVERAAIRELVLPIAATLKRPLDCNRAA